MCGLVGFIHKDRQLSESQFENMYEIIKYRGPNDQGAVFHQSSNGEQIGLAHVRLSILDLSSSGHQPMVFDDLTIVYNGEVYNYKEIRDELLACGYEFNSETDTEVILKAFHKWGVAGIDKFIGMFSIGLFNQSDNSLLLVRDRMGIKPLYYFYDGSNIVFSSELKPIMEYPFFKKEIDLNSLHAYLCHGYLSAPHTIFKNVYKLEAGKYLKYCDGNLAITSYWSIKDIYKNRRSDDSRTEEELINELDGLLLSSVQYRMISDVPIGSFLSGGIDSSLITALMTKLSPAPVNTFSIGFKNKSFNEAEYARDISDKLETNHHELYFSDQDYFDLIRDIPKYYDEPFADVSQLPSLLVSKLAKSKVSVVLTGDGGDELFCGYQVYDRIYKLKRRKLVSKVLNVLNYVLPIERILMCFGVNKTKLLFSNTDVNIINETFLVFSNVFKGIVKDHVVKFDHKYSDMTKLTDNVQEARMLSDMVTYLPEDILAKVDRATMASSLEGRVPLLDHRIVEFALNLPHKYKYKEEEKKYLLKKVLYKYLPEEMFNRPKQGFGVPISEWLNQNLDYIQEKYLSPEFIENQGLFDSTVIDKLYQGYQTDKSYPYDRYLWHFVVFQMWFEEYMV